MAGSDTGPTRCSAPTCPSVAIYEVVATDAGDATGKTFYVCPTHLRTDDFRRILEEVR